MSVREPLAIGREFAIGTKCSLSALPSTYSQFNEVQWNQDEGQSVINVADDPTRPIGVYLIYVKGTSMIYKHGIIELTKTTPARTEMTPDITFLSNRQFGGATSAPQKMYAIFNNDLTGGELTTIKTIFEKYQNLL